MKKILTLFAMLTLFVSMMAQTPFNYQAVLREKNTNTNQYELVRNQSGDVTVTVATQTADVPDTLLKNFAFSTNSDGMVNLRLEAREGIDWNGAVITAVFTYDGKTLTLNSPVSAVPYAYHADNAILTTQSIENYLASGVDGEHAALLHAALKSNSEFHDACRDTVVEYIKANYDKAKEIAYDYLRQVTSTDVNQFYNEACGLNQEVKDSLYSVAKRFLKDNRDLVKEMAMYYAGSATSEEIQQLYTELQGNDEASAKVRSLLNRYFDAYLIRKGLYCDHATLCDIYSELRQSVIDYLSVFRCGRDNLVVGNNSYPTVQIGTQCWTKTNMREVAGNYDATSCRYEYCYKDPNYYINPDLDASVYGYYYNWPGANIVCPLGWHLPSTEEWTTMLKYVSSYQEGGEYKYRCDGDSISIAKAFAFTSGWREEDDNCVVGNNQAANNKTGFSAVPAGFWRPADDLGEYDAGFCDVGRFAHFWTSTRYENFSWQDSNGYYVGYVWRDVKMDSYADNRSMRSVRCVKD